MSSSSFSGPQGLSHNCLKVAIGLVLAAAAAGAQSAEPKEEVSLPKISVQDEAPAPTNKIDALSSPKFTQPLLDTPQTITIVSSSLLRQQGARTLTQALRNIPGVTFQLGENGNTATGDSLFLRGFDTQGSIFVDGIRDLGAVSRDVFNIEQVEVAKGPSGADYGRGAASGYVNLASKVPVNDSFMNSDLSYGTADNARATGDWNQSFNGGSTAVRVNVMGQEGGVDGRDFVEDQTWAFAPSVAFGLGSNTRTYFNLLTSKQERRPDGGVPTIGQDGYTTASLADQGLPNPPAPDSENYYGFLNDFDDVKSTMFTARIEHDFSSNVRLRNSSRYGKKEQDYLITGVNAVTANADPDLSTVARTRQTRHQENTILTNQTNLNAEFKAFGLDHALASGFEVIYEKQFSPTVVGAGTVPMANINNPNERDPIAGLDLTRDGRLSDGETTTVGLYAFDTLSLTEKWKLTAGLRVDNYDTEFNGVAASTAASNPNLPVGTLIPSRLDKSGTLTSYKVGLLYKPVSNGSVYLSHATSKQPPGGANFTLTSGVNVPGGTNNVNVNSVNIDPQEGSNVELGTKWDFRGGKLGVTAALFNSENKNDLVQADPTDPSAVLQSGKRRVRGIELGVVGQLTDAWQISAGVTKQDTKVIEGSVTATTNQTGQPINFSPELTFTSWTTYSFPFGLTVGGGLRYVDSQSRTINSLLTSANANLREIPSYYVIDAAIGYGITERVSVQLNLYNLTDEDYLDQVNNSGQRYIPSRPLSGVLSVAVGL